MDTKPIKDFKKFIDREIDPAVTDLTKLDEKNRVHVQKLVYTNIIDRFDTMIDATILANCRDDYLVDEATKTLTSTITEADLLRLLLHSDDLQDALSTKLQNSLRNSMLQQRHSKKLRCLFTLVSPDINCWSAPCINISTGDIVEKIKPQKNAKQPYSICGYSDWLYSRRNSIVHGAGTTTFLKNDQKQLKALYKCVPAKTFKIKLASVSNMITFYRGVVELLVA